MIIAQVCLSLATIKCHSKMLLLYWGRRGPYPWPPFASCSATYLLHIEWSGCLLWPVECWSTPLQWKDERRSCWILAITGTRCCIRRSRASQTCSKGDMSSEYADHAWTGMLTMHELGCIQLPEIVYRSVQHGAVHYHAATWGDGRG